MPHNVRVFEQLDGLLTITSLFKSRETGREVKFRLTEFLYFYLTPESPLPALSRPTSSSSSSATGAAPQQGLVPPRSPSKLAKVLGVGGGKADGSRPASQADGGGANGGGMTLSVEEKKQLLDRYLPGVVDELLKDLDTYKPFGGILS